MQSGSVAGWSVEVSQAAGELLESPLRIRRVHERITTRRAGQGYRSNRAERGAGSSPALARPPSLSRQGACSGVLRGIGKQKFGAILNAVGYYGVGLPLGAVLLFVARIGVIGTDPGACSSANPPQTAPKCPTGRCGFPLLTATLLPGSALLPGWELGTLGWDWEGPCSY